VNRFFVLFSAGLLVASLSFATHVCAQDVGPYLSASVGQSDVDLPGFDEGTSFSLGLGYSVNKNFAVEAYYIDFGESEDNIAPVWTLSADALAFAVVGKLPFNEMVSAYAKLGFFAWDAELEEAGFGQIASDDGADLTYGLGVLLNVTEKFACFAQSQNYELDDVDIDNISLGIQFGF